MDREKFICNSVARKALMSKLYTIIISESTIQLVNSIIKENKELLGSLTLFNVALINKIKLFFKFKKKSNIDLKYFSKQKYTTKIKIVVI